MSRKPDLLVALKMLTEGARAPVARAMQAEALSVHSSSRKWTHAKGIQGLGIARKTTNGKLTDELALKVYVDRKLPKAKCKSGLIPKTIDIHNIKGKLVTDVEAIGVVRKEANTSRVRPAIPGFSCHHDAIDSAGTLGCLVRKKGKTPLYILSNSHVLALEGMASVGDRILQPGRYDDGVKSRDQIGTLSEWIPFTFTEEGYPNYVDAALAKVKKSDVTSAIHKIGVPTGVGTARMGTKVKKCGRSTDFTHGEVLDVNHRTFLSYANPNSTPSPGTAERVGFQDQVLCTRYTAVGDSGSAVLNSDDRIVGLHFAGSDSSSIFNKIHHVIRLLDIEIVTEFF